MPSVDDFRAALLEFRELFQQLQAARESATSPAWRARFDALIGRGRWVFKIVERLGALSDSFTGWLRDLFGDGDRQQLSGLSGWFLPAAVIGGAMYYLVPYIDDVRDALTEWRQSGEFEMPGNPVSDAINDVKKTGDLVAQTWAFAKVAVPAVVALFLIDGLIPKR